jgi:hypothetical protein
LTLFAELFLCFHVDKCFYCEKSYL